MCFFYKKKKKIDTIDKSYIIQVRGRVYKSKYEQIIVLDLKSQLKSAIKDSTFSEFLQLKKYLREFLNDTYPGAKRSPIDYVKLLSMPDIKPDAAIKGIAPLSQIC